jgi:hypothetical protein
MVKHSLHAGLNPGHSLLSGRSRVERAIRPPVWPVPNAGSETSRMSAAALSREFTLLATQIFRIQGVMIRKTNVIV